MRWAWVSVLLVCACASPSDAEPTTASTTPSPVASTGTTVAETPIATSPEAAATDEVSDTAPPAPSADGTSPSATIAPPISAGVVPAGFATTQAVVTEPDGTTCELCLWLADTARQRARGLMFVTDLGPAEGMAFRYPDPHTGTFWMKNTVLPLSIAFVDSDGALLDRFDMEPCTTPTCPKYSTPRNFLVAVEVPQGELDAVGLVPGSRLELLDVPCEE